MSDGKIFGNTAGIGGGGVSVGYGSSFTMNGGEISGNTAGGGYGGYGDGNGGGGGVWVHGANAAFTKSGGIIYGQTGDARANIAKNATADPVNTWGHAVFYLDGGGYYYYRDTSLYANENISTTDTLPANSGDTLGNWTRKP
jgi:hypothetical protein